MNITLKKLGSARTQATVIIDDTVAKKAEKEVVQNLGSEVKIKGFRPGKAPADKIREQISEQRIQEEVVRHVMPEIMKEAIETHKLNPIIRPNVELSSLAPLTIIVTLVEKPEVKVETRKVMKATKVVKESNKEGKENKEIKKSGEQEESKLLDLLAEHTKVDLASELIDDEVRDLIQQHAQRLTQFGLDLEKWLKQTGKSIEDFIKEVRPDAEKRLKVRFGIGELINEWKVDVSDEEMTKAIQKLLKPLDVEKRAELETLYVPGEHPYEQFRFQKKVEKVMTKLRG